MIWTILRHWISSVVSCVPHDLENCTTLDFQKIVRHWISSVVVCVPHDLENCTTLDLHDLENCTTLDFQCRGLRAT